MKRREEKEAKEEKLEELAGIKKDALLALRPEQPPDCLVNIGRSPRSPVLFYKRSGCGRNRILSGDISDHSLHRSVDFSSRRDGCAQKDVRLI
ncbi:hypothetical protein EYF80_017800 [Liparis tanakae]|uniref:Uncharacterized protein n=1 Tax=Liparis tanakae TaxID=230148 RepID=A0A4Z2I424_9TELE|nr:hypothetical protein EYF80_017800 [Liparis tanakae]